MSAITIPSFDARRTPAAMALFAAAALVSVPGCGVEDSIPRASTSGVVYTDGVELASGAVRFVPVEGTPGPAVVAPVRDGYFALPAENGPIVGTHRIEIVATNFLGFDPGDQEAAERALRESGGKLPRSPVPPRYGKKSPLTAEVPPEGAEGLVFLLTSDVQSTSSRSRSGMSGYAAAR